MSSTNEVKPLTQANGINPEVKPEPVLDFGFEHEDRMIENQEQENQNQWAPREIQDHEMGQEQEEEEDLTQNQDPIDQFEDVIFDHEIHPENGYHQEQYRQEVKPGIPSLAQRYERECEIRDYHYREHKRAAQNVAALLEQMRQENEANLRDEDDDEDEVAVVVAAPAPAPATRKAPVKKRKTNTAPRTVPKKQKTVPKKNSTSTPSRSTTDPPTTTSFNPHTVYLFTDGHFYSLNRDNGSSCNWVCSANGKNCTGRMKTSSNGTAIILITPHECGEVPESLMKECGLNKTVRGKVYEVSREKATSLIREYTKSLPYVAKQLLVTANNNL